MSENLYESISRNLKKVKGDLIFVSVALMAVGLLLAFFCGVSTEIISLIAGIAIAAWGVVRTAGYFVNLKDGAFSSFGLVQGVVMLIFGVYIILKPEFLASLIGSVRCVVIIIDGILKLQYAIDLFHLNVKAWWGELVVSLVMTAVGVIILVNPFNAISTLFLISGIILVIEGACDLFSILFVSKVAKKASREALEKVYEAELEENEE